MGLNDSILKVEKKYAWSFFGFLLAALFGAFSVYTVYFIDTNPQLDFIVESNTKVLDLRENVKKLQIIYETENINDNDKNLSILKVRIQNTSNVNILSTFYDVHDPLGFKLDFAEIVEKPELIESSTDYIKNNIIITLDSLGNVKFNSLILDGQDYFTLKLLALHKQSEIPKILPFGKIAGVKTIGIIETYKNSEEKDLWDRVKEGSIGVHLLRFLGYILSFIVVGLIIAIPSALISETLTERKRKRHVRKYKTKKKLTDSLERDLIYEMYINHGLDFLVSTERLFIDEKLLKISLRSYLRKVDRMKHKEIVIEQREIIEDGHLHIPSDSRRRAYINERQWILSKLHEDKIIQLDNNELTINNQFVNDLKEFVSYLKLI
jgi:hypothetical protein